ncbi:MAG TPA: hypothetical protein VII95_12550 [Terriglobales bacterium]|jgi:hypothetical protein
MRNTWCGTSRTLTVLLVASGMAFAQVEHQSRTLLVNGRSGQAAIIQENGRAYVDLEALAQIANGSLSFNANRIVLTLPPSPVSTPISVDSPNPAENSGLSRDFMKAGIEEIALIREWGSPVGYAIQNGYSITEEWVARYREQAAHGLRMASVAASTNADRNALQLLTTEFEGVRDWSNKLVEARRSMDTAKYSMSANALRDDPQSQKLIACWRFLASMLGSGSFQDDSSCH